MSPWLRMEVEALGFPIIAEGFMGVETEGTMHDCMKLNLWLRIGHRVLYHLKTFEATGPSQLYDKIIEIEWENYIDAFGYFSIISYANNEEILDTRFASLKCKDAIADHFLKTKNRRPDSGSDKNKAVVFLHWKDTQASVYIDTSGETIAKHGYRKIPLKAPMQETLAAAIIYASAWDGKTNLVNPMCGSGTIAIEAALLATNKAPGLLRSNFGFMYIQGFDAETWEKLRSEARKQAYKKSEGKIIASDISKEAVAAAVNNAKTAGVDHLIEFDVCDFKETEVSAEGGIVIINPEYGERLGEEEKLEETYKQIGDFFKQQCKGYKGYVFTGNMNLAKKIGLKTKRRIEFYNGTIDCRLLEYELYEGSRRIKDTPVE